MNIVKVSLELILFKERGVAFIACKKFFSMLMNICKVSVKTEFSGKSFMTSRKMAKDAACWFKSLFFVRHLVVIKVVVVIVIVLINTKTKTNTKINTKTNT